MISHNFLLLVCASLGIHLAACTDMHPQTPPPSPTSQSGMECSPVPATTQPAITWGNEVHGVKLGLAMETTTLDPCLPVFVTVYMNNTTNQDIVIPYPYSEFNFQTEMKDAQGHQVKLTEYGKMDKRFAHPRFAETSHTLKPGINGIRGFLANHKYDMTLSGDYYLKLSAPIADGYFKTVTSGQLKITIR